MSPGTSTTDRLHQQRPGQYPALATWRHASRSVDSVRLRLTMTVDGMQLLQATMNEIARTLKRAGAERVEVLTVARVANDIYRREETRAATDVSMTQ